jgi:hypothetical protein
VQPVEEVRDILRDLTRQGLVYDELRDRAAGSRRRHHPSQRGDKGEEARSYLLAKNSEKQLTVNLLGIDRKHLRPFDASMLTFGSCQLPDPLNGAVAPTHSPLLIPLVLPDLITLYWHLDVDKLLPFLCLDLNEEHDKGTR